MKRIIEELKRRNVFKATLAYLVIAWILLQVASIVLPIMGSPDWVLKTFTFFLAIGLPIWMFFSWVYEITPEGIKKTNEVSQNEHKTAHINKRLNILLIISLAIVGGFILYSQIWNKSIDKIVVDNEDLRSIAVLAFTNMSSDKNQDYFCDGIAEDILNDLVYVEGLRVVARTSSFAFKDKDIDIREIGKKLNVQTVLEGSVQKSENTLRITAQLINVEDGYHIWSKRYERELEDVFAIQTEIAQNIAQALKIKLSKKEKNNLEKIKTKNITAYDYYMRGRDYYNKGHHDKVLLSVPMFRKAIKTDPNYTLAYVGLADSYAHLYMYFERTEYNLNQALITSEKALELDAELAESHSARAIALFQNKQFDKAEEEFKLAIQLNPKLFQAYYENARMFKSLGNDLEAAKLFKKASLIEPDNYQPLLFLTSAYKNLNMEDEMIKSNEQTIKVLMTHLEFYPDDARALYLGASALIIANDSEKALLWIEKATSIDSDEISVLYNATCIYSKLGKIDEALDYFDKAIEAGFASRNWIDNDTDLDNIRNHPRFEASLKKIN